MNSTCYIAEALIWLLGGGFSTDIDQCLWADFCSAIIGKCTCTVMHVVVKVLYLNCLCV